MGFCAGGRAIAAGGLAGTVAPRMAVAPTTVHCGSWTRATHGVFASCPDLEKRHAGVLQQNERWVGRHCVLCDRTSKLGLTCWVIAPRRCGYWITFLRRIPSTRYRCALELLGRAARARGGAFQLVDSVPPFGARPYDMVVERNIPYQRHRHSSTVEPYNYVQGVFVEGCHGVDGSRRRRQTSV